MYRTSTTSDTVSTKFGSIPLDSGESENLGSVNHSRTMLKGEYGEGPVTFTGYLESDFLNPNPAQSPFRWRQYWGAARVGKWEILGGRAWSLLRPNREGVHTDTDTMNTHVVDPAYHVGLIGSRLRQVRLKRYIGDTTVAFAWEGPGNFVAKVAHDRNHQHLELAAFTGHYGRRGIQGSAVLSPTARVHLVTQEYWGENAAYQALGVVAPGISGLAALQGAEVRVAKNTEIYSYGGLVYADHVKATENRVVREATVGIDHKIHIFLNSSILISLQYSYLDRSIWSGRQGVMHYVQYRMRYTFN